jgi:DNA-binding CsgD family transcriptional regulator
VAFLDAEARLRWASRRAREILGRRDGLALDAQGLRAASPAEGAALRQAVAEAAAGGGPVSRILTLHRASGKRPYGAMLAPLRAGSHGSARGALVALFLNDPEGEACTDVDAVRELHGLTPTEARIAAALANGRSPEETAGALGMRLSTLRHHLKHVFAKTETSRQASLVRLLLGGPATLRRV